MGAVGPLVEAKAPVRLTVTPTRRNALAPAAIWTLGQTKHFGRVIALDGLALHVDAAETFGFLGPHWADESAAIGLLVGLIRPTAVAPSWSATFVDVQARAR